MTRPQYLEVIGGPLAGQIVEISADTTEYVAVRPDGRGVDIYRARWWTKLDSDGKKLWERVCLVWEAR